LVVILPIPLQFLTGIKKGSCAAPLNVVANDNSL
jgi:hypothetical protein